MNPHSSLQNRFGYAVFRFQHEAVVASVMQKKDVLIVTPTGEGKSLYFQIPALLLDGLTLVISPRIAQMKNQVATLRIKGIEAAYLSSTQSRDEQETVLRRIDAKAVKLLYLAPEKVLRSDQTIPLLDTLTSFNISLIVIDEAQCISHWGRNFMREYLMLVNLKTKLPDTPIIALTAIADALTQEDTIEKLRLQDPAVFVTSYNRRNIRYTVTSRNNSFEKLLRFLETRKDASGIIYCFSRNATENLASDLLGEGFKALPYHDAMDHQQRIRHQQMFLQDEVKIMVATIAFGMGIDKPNIRYVVHLDLPKNIETYYRETGDAGRDGLASEALLFYSPDDTTRLKKIVIMHDDADRKKIALKKLADMGRYAQLTSCRRKYLLNYFNEMAPQYCGNCDICLTHFELYDGTALAQKVITAVNDLGQNDSLGVVIDFLRGSVTARRYAGQQTPKSYGSGANLSREQWYNIISDLIARSYLTKTEDAYSPIKVSEKGIAVMDGVETVMLAKAKEQTEVIAQVNEEEAPYDKDLLQQLKDMRRHLAAVENVAPYIVLSNETLIELATYLPHTLEEFSMISGFGEVKIEKYGKQFRNVIAAYCLKWGLTSRFPLKRSSHKSYQRQSARDSKTKQETLRLFMEGCAVEEIASRRKLSISTVQGHLAFYIQQGKIPIEQLMDTKKVETIQQAIETIGGNTLTPVKASLGNGVSYTEIKYVIAYMENQGFREPECWYESDSFAFQASSMLVEC